MKQTAVEWLIENLEERGYIFEKKENIIIEQAKEMEKQQIIKANTAGVNQGLYGYKNAEEYYNATFKNK